MEKKTQKLDDIKAGDNKKEVDEVAEKPETEENAVSEEALAVAKKQATLSYRIRRARWSYGMIAPYFILFFFFTVLPVAMSIVLSFTYFNMLDMAECVGWN